jgi:hypothetical protein
MRQSAADDLIRSSSAGAYRALRKACLLQPSVRFPCPVGLVKLHGPAKSLQLGTVDAVNPHPELKNCYRKDLRRLQIGAFNESGAIFLESSDNGTQMRLGVRDQTQPIV